MIDWLLASSTFFHFRKASDIFMDFITNQYLIVKIETESYCSIHRIVGNLHEPSPRSQPSMRSRGRKSKYRILMYFINKANTNLFINKTNIKNRY